MESLLVGVSVGPGLLVARFILNLPLPLSGKYVETLLLGVAFVPGYFVFCLGLMFWTAVATRLLRWRATPGAFELRRTDWPVVRWAQYNAAIHVVRIFAGGVLRSTPLWTWFIRLNGARVGRNVHVNTLSIYDHNLLSLGDNAVVGSDVKISAHVGDAGRLLVGPVVVGRGVTLGTNAIVQPDVEIGDGARVLPMSLVPKGTRLPPRSVAGGVPAQVLPHAPDEPHSGETLARP